MLIRICLALLAVVATAGAAAADLDSATVPMRDKGAQAYYVNVDVTGLGRHAFLVDTGAGYMTINEDMLAALERSEQVTYVKELEGVLADGSRLIVPVYRIKQINIGGDCELRNVEAAVFPGSTRSLLGLSVLRKTAPVSISMEPPTLRLNNCLTASTLTPTQRERRRMKY